MNTDITKCSGEGCPWKSKCVRYITPADKDIQAYFSTPPGKMDDEEVFVCDMFWGEPQEAILKQLRNITNGNKANGS
jgi:hypothetical protein